MMKTLVASPGVLTPFTAVRASTSSRGFMVGPTGPGGGLKSPAERNQLPKKRTQRQRGTVVLTNCDRMLAPFTDFSSITMTLLKGFRTAGSSHNRANLRRSDPVHRLGTEVVVPVPY